MQEMNHARRETATTVKPRETGTQACRQAMACYSVRPMLCHGKTSFTSIKAQACHKAPWPGAAPRGGTGPESTTSRDNQSREHPRARDRTARAGSACGRRHPARDQRTREHKTVLISKTRSRLVHDHDPEGRERTEQVRWGNDGRMANATQKPQHVNHGRKSRTDL